MSKHDFAKRLKRVIHEESEIIKTETKMAQKSAKYCEKLSDIRKTLIKQYNELFKYFKHIQKLKHENSKLQKLTQEQEYQLTLLIQRIEQMDAEYKNTLQEKIEQSQTAQLRMDCFRNVKVASQTFLNVKALPQLIQGVTVSEKDSSSKWNPFCIDPTHHTQKEVEDIIWHEEHNDSELKKTWETLIFGDILSDTSKLTNMDTNT